MPDLYPPPPLHQAPCCHLVSLNIAEVSGLDGATLAGVFAAAVLDRLGPTLQSLDMSGCGLTGVIPPALWRAFDRLRVLRLRSRRS